MIRARVREWIEYHRLLPPDGNIVAACSGGPDSLALVDLLESMRGVFGFDLFVAHVDHGLRGEESCEDAEYVRQFCADLRLPFFCGRVEVKKELRRRGGSLEEVARQLRYQYLRRIAGEVGGAWIATGHHRDDQAETLLMNLLRGSGGRGLGAMRPKQGDVIHPLLCLGRSEIEAYCRERNIHPRHDSSNDEVEFRRNRVRHELMPLLQSRFNPALTDTLCRTADILSEGQDFLRGYVEEHLQHWTVRVDDGYRLEAKVFSSLPVAVQRELLMLLLEKCRGDARGLFFAHVEQVRELFLKDRGFQQMDLPGNWQARKSYQDLFIESVKSAGADQERERLGHGDPIQLECPGDTFLPDFGILVRCTLHEGNGPLQGILDERRVAFDRESLQMPMVARCRRPGDRFRPLGAPGTRKLKKMMIDLKIPVGQRDRTPLIADAAGLLWVAGWRRSERGRLSANTRGYIMLELLNYDNTH